MSVEWIPVVQYGIKGLVIIGVAWAVAYMWGVMFK